MSIRDELRRGCWFIALIGLCQIVIIALVLWKFGG